MRRGSRSSRLIVRFKWSNSVWVESEIVVGGVADD